MGSPVTQTTAQTLQSNTQGLSPSLVNLYWCSTFYGLILIGLFMNYLRWEEASGAVSLVSSTRTHKSPGCLRGTCPQTEVSSGNFWGCFLSYKGKFSCLQMAGLRMYNWMRSKEACVSRCAFCVFKEHFFNFIVIFFIISWANPMYGLIICWTLLFCHFYYFREHSSLIINYYI